MIVNGFNSSFSFAIGCVGNNICTDNVRFMRMNNGGLESLYASFYDAVFMCQCRPGCLIELKVRTRKQHERLQCSQRYLL
jgi:hypothetical protein